MSIDNTEGCKENPHDGSTDAETDNIRNTAPWLYWDELGIDDLDVLLSAPYSDMGLRDFSDTKLTLALSPRGEINISFDSHPDGPGDDRRYAGGTLTVSPEAADELARNLIGAAERARSRQELEE